LVAERFCLLLAQGKTGKNCTYVNVSAVNKKFSLAVVCVAQKAACATPALPSVQKTGQRMVCHRRQYTNHGNP
jgi:hypothetical protein